MVAQFALNRGRQASPLAAQSILSPPTGRSAKGDRRNETEDPHPNIPHYHQDVLPDYGPRSRPETSQTERARVE